LITAVLLMSVLSVAADVTILVTKPIGKRRQYARIVHRHDGLSDCHLLPKDLFALELVDECSRALGAVDTRRLGFARRNKDQSLLTAAAIAVPAASCSRA